MTQSNITRTEKHDEEVTVGRLWCRQSSNSRLVDRNVRREGVTALLAATRLVNMRYSWRTRVAARGRRPQPH